MSGKPLELLATMGTLFGVPVRLDTHVRSDDILDNSRTQIMNLLCEWSAQVPDSSGAAEGWGLYNVPCAADQRYMAAWLTCGIERVDESEAFEDDDSAQFHVARRALEGSRVHLAAMQCHLLANALRFCCWGEAYVSSRTGPEIRELTPDQLSSVQDLADAHKRGPLTPVGMPGW